MIHSSVATTESPPFRVTRKMPGHFPMSDYHVEWTGSRSPVCVYCSHTVALSVQCSGSVSGFLFPVMWVWKQTKEQKCQVLDCQMASVENNVAEPAVEAAGPTSFKCEQCDRIFGTIQGLRVHIRRLHRAEPEAEQLRQSFTKRISHFPFHLVVRSYRKSLLILLWKKFHSLHWRGIQDSR